MCKAQVMGIKLLWESWSIVIYSGVIGLQDAVVEGVKTALNQWEAEIGFYFLFYQSGAGFHCYLLQA